MGEGERERERKGWGYKRERHDKPDSECHGERQGVREGKDKDLEKRENNPLC